MDTDDTRTVSLESIIWRDFNQRRVDAKQAVAYTFMLLTISWTISVGRMKTLANIWAEIGDAACEQQEALLRLILI